MRAGRSRCPRINRVQLVVNPASPSQWCQDRIQNHEICSRLLLPVCPSPCLSLRTLQTGWLYKRARRAQAVAPNCSCVNVICGNLWERRLTEHNQRLKKCISLVCLPLLGSWLRDLKENIGRKRHEQQQGSLAGSSGPSMDSSNLKMLYIFQLGMCLTITL